MMKDIYGASLLDLLPQSLTSDPFVKAVAAAIDPELQSIAAEIVLCLLLSRIDELPEDVVDHLAWQFHVDFYEPPLTLAQKRALVKGSREWHLHKGTPWAVEQLVSIFFDNPQVDEWWLYNADPYHFQIEIGPQNVKERSIEQLNKMIDVAKNARSWFDGFVVALTLGPMLLANNSYNYRVIFPYHPYGEKEFALLEVGAVGVVDDTYGFGIAYPFSKRLSFVTTGDDITAANNIYDYMKIFPETGALEPPLVQTITQSSRLKANPIQYHYPVTLEAPTKRARVIAGDAVGAVNEGYDYIKPFPVAGTLEPLFKPVSLQATPVATATRQYDYRVKFDMPVKLSGVINGESIQQENDAYGYIKPFPETGTMEPMSKAVETGVGAAFSYQDSYGYAKTYPICGLLTAKGD